MTLRLTFILLIFSILFASCSNYTRVMKGKDMDAKSDLAYRLYSKGDYYRAMPLFEELITVYRGTRKAEKLYYHYAYTNYHLGDYQSAAYDFENFTKTFPNSEYAEECAFMHAYCYFEDSPDFSLDQTNTFKAINELQLFADRYPASSRIPECNRLIDELRGKLESKDFENAKLYYNMESYKASITAFKNLIQDYPATNYREQAMFLIIKAGFLLAENSVEEKKAGRYNEALGAYTEFISNYPDSKYKKEADELSAQIRKKLDKIPSDNISNIN
ncbi:MAG: outer membrane protein assembly factor BamD [Bacteroidetes bacterium]|nr:MAG: outer membrane protein assembly factor BamD [Bacteroidota bacterium]REJ99884.1 MAG: outer membrane protein assembly factor BamD [Bacteroidota bacterium]REK50587.1 MAG: outer membrane protein assembly factor BamD [Bacteroidota bacterium]